MKKLSEKTDIMFLESEEVVRDFEMVELKGGLMETGGNMSNFVCVGSGCPCNPPDNGCGGKCVNPTGADCK